MGRRVDIHIGLHKTGTTYLQRSLYASRSALADAGVLVPGEGHLFQRRGFWDLMGRRMRGVDQPKLAGSWDALAAEVTGWAGSQVLLSDEFLVYARRGQVRRLLRALEPAEVHVVVTVRDLARVIGSMWQQEVSQGRTWTWPEFVASVRDPESGATAAGVAFWLKHDLRRVLATWESFVPAERIHVVVVPPAGAPPEELLERYAAATRLDATLLTPAPREENTSVGPAEAELLRRVNVRLGDRLNERQYTHVVNGVVRPLLREVSPTARITLSPDDRSWVTERSRELVDLLQHSGYDVVGDPSELLLPPAEDGDDADSGVVLRPGALEDAATAALAAVVEQYARHWWRTRRRNAESEAPVSTRVASGWRSLGWRARQRGLELADRNPVAARAARTYLRLSSRAARFRAR
jgi:hypothetical protein